MPHTSLLAAYLQLIAVRGAVDAVSCLNAEHQVAHLLLHTQREQVVSICRCRLHQALMWPQSTNNHSHAKLGDVTPHTLHGQLH